MIIKKKFCLAITIILILSLIGLGVYTFAKKDAINDLEEQIITNTEVLRQLQETKTQLHNAAEALRLPYVNDLYLASQLSKKWYEIDAMEKETLEKNNIATQQLEKLRGKYLAEFELTAYCYGNITATGTTPTANRTIAVDPKVIPLGRKVYIEGYGTYIAEDTGGVVKGNIIDIYIPGYDNCINFGRRTAKVYLLD